MENKKIISSPSQCDEARVHAKYCGCVVTREDHNEHKLDAGFRKHLKERDRVAGALVSASIEQKNKVEAELEMKIKAHQELFQDMFAMITLLQKQTHADFHDEKCFWWECPIVTCKTMMGLIESFLTEEGFREFLAAEKGE
jgi:hypothetical protein